MHLPVNHRLSGFYRFLAALVGMFLIAFGVLGAMQTWGAPLFQRGEIIALGLRTNLAFSLLSIVAGVVVLSGAVIGGNIAHYLNLLAGIVFWLSGLVMLLLLQTRANILNFEVATCIVSFLIGTVLFCAGLFGKHGTMDEKLAEDAFRHSGRGKTGDVVTPGHHLAAHPDVKHRQEQ